MFSDWCAIVYRGGLSLLTVTALTILDRGANRGKILKLIEEQPGLTLYDIKRRLDLNVGTVRYHLMILSLNHMISTFNDGTKYVRYFRNSNTFSEKEKMVISMLRRPHVKDMLEAILEKPGIQNIEIAAFTGVPESLVSRYMRMIAMNGIVMRVSANGERAVYVVVNNYLEMVYSSIKLIKCDYTTNYY